MFLRKTDSMRFDLALKLAKERINWETNKTLMIFVSFMELVFNASDKDICNITDELLILKRNGCKADFTFQVLTRI